MQEKTPGKPDKRPRLGDRDYDIFQHVMRYHMTTREVLHRLFFDDSDPNAVTKVASRLVLHEYLKRHEMYPPRTYFVLGPEATRLVGVSQKRSSPLGPLALAREFATLAFCCLAPEPRVRLTVREVQEIHPQLLQPGLDSSHYYLDNDGTTTRLAYIRVDCGGPVDHIVRKCREDIRDRYQHEAFRQYIDNDRFMIAIVTARAEKAAAIHEALKRHQWNCRFRLETVPELANLITRLDSD